MRPPTNASAKERAWNAFAAFIRKRDKICITCSTPSSQAGHFNHERDKGTNPNLGGNMLWYNKKNVNGQCSSCNLYKSGNIAEYAVKIEEKWGDGTIKELYKLRNTQKKFTIEELLEIEAEYKSLL